MAGKKIRLGRREKIWREKDTAWPARNDMAGKEKRRRQQSTSATKKSKHAAAAAAASINEVSIQ